MQVESTDGDLVGASRTEKLWRVIPVDDTAARDFFYWYKSCNRQWFSSAQEATYTYCDKWKEWHYSASKAVDHSADTIEYRP